MQGVSKKSFTMVFQMFMASVTKTFTLKGVQTIHRSRCLKIDSLYVLKCKLFVTLATHIWNTTVKLFFATPCIVWANKIFPTLGANWSHVGLVGGKELVI
jgi:hypothetical protein